MRNLINSTASVRVHTTTFIKAAVAAKTRSAVNFEHVRAQRLLCCMLA